MFFYANVRTVNHEDEGLEAHVPLPVSHESAADLCQFIFTEEVDVVICGGIEKEFYDYLVWKKVNVLDSVMGPWEQAIDRFRSGDLEAHDTL